MPPTKQSITKKEKEVLAALTKEYLTPKQIVIRLKCSKQAIYKHIKNLRKKGLFSISTDMVDSTQSTSQPKRIFKPQFPMQKQYRLHGQEFNIKIIKKGDKYRDLIKKSNLIIIDGNTIRLYQDSIEIYIGQSFYGYEVNEITKESFIYLNRIISRLENDTRCILSKSRYQNIKLVNSHYAEVGNELARHCNANSEKIRIETTDDGKIWFQIDKSLNFDEAETIHPETAKRDMESIIKPFFNDLRNNSDKVLLSSQIAQFIKEIAIQNRETASGLNAVAHILSMQFRKPEQPKEDNIKPDYVG